MATTHKHLRLSFDLVQDYVRQHGANMPTYKIEAFAEKNRCSSGNAKRWIMVFQLEKEVISAFKAKCLRMHNMGIFFEGKPGKNLTPLPREKQLELLTKLVKNIKIEPTETDLSKLVENISPEALKTLQDILQKKIDLQIVKEVDKIIEEAVSIIFNNPDTQKLIVTQKLTAKDLMDRIEHHVKINPWFPGSGMVRSTTQKVG